MVFRRGVRVSGLAVTLLLISIVVGLMAFPLVTSDGAAFRGTDDIARQALADQNPDTQPWFSALWTPPNGQVEGLLFALQAALGAGVVGYCLGLKRGRSGK